jgi:hypothetical protein
MKEIQAIINAFIEFYNKNIIGSLVSFVGNNAGIANFLKQLMIDLVDVVK